jgi:two-component system, LytTR family, sensor kinase
VIEGFKVHAIIYSCVNAGLRALNILTEPQVLWFNLPLVGWGIGLASHYYFGVSKYLQSFEENELRAEGMAEEEC